MTKGKMVFIILMLDKNGHSNSIKTAPKSRTYQIGAVRKPKARSKEHVECCDLFSTVSFEHSYAGSCMWNKYLTALNPIVQPNSSPRLSSFK